MIVARSSRTARDPQQTQDCVAAFDPVISL